MSTIEPKIDRQGTDRVANSAVILMLADKMRLDLVKLQVAGL